MDKATPGMARVLVVVLLGVSGVWGQSTRPVRREIVRYTTGQRVEFLRTDEWEPATVLGWENRKVRVRTDGNEEFLAQTVQVRKFTNAASYPVKAAAEDIAAINPTPAGQVGGVDEKQLDAIKPGLAQPAEADPVEEKAKVVAPAPVVVREETLPLPPAPNVLPGEVVAGDLTTATGLAAPEKVETRAIWERDGAAGLAHPVSGKGFVLRELDTQDAVFEGAAPLLFTSPEFGQVFVPHRDRSPEAATDLYYDRYDCATGERTGGFAVPPGGKVLDLSGDGTRMLLSWTSDSSGGVQEDCLGVFVVLNDRLSLKVAWRPYGGLRDQTARGVDSAYFVDGGHVLTSTGNDLVCWDVGGDGVRGVYRLYPIAPCRPAMSPTRRYVGIVSGGTVWLLEALTGQPAMKMEPGLPAGGFGPLSIRGDGGQIACLMESRLMVWNLGETPGLASDVTVMLPKGEGGKTLDWLSPGYVMVNQKYCADLGKQVMLWEYGLEENGVAGAFAGEYWYSKSGGGKRVLGHRVLPGEAEMRVEGKIDPAKVMLIHPGVKVSIDLSKVEGDMVLKSRAAAALTAKLQAEGVEVAENQPVRLVVTSEPGEVREVTYRGAGGESTVNVPEDLVTVAFVEDGKVAWHVTRAAMAPGVLALRPGETVEEFLGRERARLRLVAAMGVGLPKFVARGGEGVFYGRTELGK